MNIFLVVLFVCNFISSRSLSSSSSSSSSFSSSSPSSSSSDFVPPSPAKMLAERTRLERELYSFVKITSETLSRILLSIRDTPKSVSGKFIDAPQGKGFELSQEFDRFIVECKQKEIEYDQSTDMHSFPDFREHVFNNFDQIWDVIENMKKLFAGFEFTNRYDDDYFRDHSSLELIRGSESDE